MPLLAAGEGDVADVEEVLEEAANVVEEVGGETLGGAVTEEVTGEVEAAGGLTVTVTAAAAAGAEVVVDVAEVVPVAGADTATIVGALPLLGAVPLPRPAPAAGAVECPFI